VTYREAAAKLRRLGCEEVRRRGSHRRWVNPATGGRTTLPDWGPRDLKVGTLHAAVRALGLAWQAFEEA
jgi:mRNA interferase HicA